jgi:hypothetical protein
MGIFGAIGQFISDLQGSTESYNQGENWASSVIEHHKGRYTLDYEVDEDAVRDTGEEYASDPDAFYEGFSDTWNSHMKEVEPQKDGFLEKMGRFLFQ